MLLYALSFNPHNPNLEVYISIIYPHLAIKEPKAPMLSNLPKITQQSVYFPTTAPQKRWQRQNHPLATKEKETGNITFLLEHLSCTKTWATYFLTKEHSKPVN